MRGPKPEWADSDDHATLEQVFSTSRSLGTRFLRLPCRLSSRMRSPRARVYFARNPFIASVAVVAVAPSIVGGTVIGNGPIGQSILSAQSAGHGPSAGNPGATTTTTVPGPAVVPPAGSAKRTQPRNGKCASGISLGREPAGVAPVCRCRGRQHLVTTERRSRACPNSTLTVVGTGLLRPARGRDEHADTDRNDDPDDDTHHAIHADHHDDHSGFVRARWCGPRRRRRDRNRWRQRQRDRKLRHRPAQAPAPARAAPARAAPARAAPAREAPAREAPGRAPAPVVTEAPATGTTATATATAMATVATATATATTGTRRAAPATRARATTGRAAHRSHPRPEQLPLNWLRVTRGLNHLAPEPPRP